MHKTAFFSFCGTMCSSWLVEMGTNSLGKPYVIHGKKLSYHHATIYIVVLIITIFVTFPKERFLCYLSQQKNILRVKLKNNLKY